MKNPIKGFKTLKVNLHYFNKQKKGGFKTSLKHLKTNLKQKNYELQIY